MLSSIFALVVFVGVCRGAPTLQSASDNRIVNGTETRVEVHPSIVQIDGYHPVSSFYQICGGSIISNGVVLTAAHCFDIAEDPWFSPENRRVRAGATYRNSGGVIVEIATILNHPNYNIATYMDFDICILRLRTLLTFGPTIRNIPILPQNFQIPDNSPAIHAGWGTLYSNGPHSSVLLQVQVNVINQELCRERYSVNGITDNMICAGVLNVVGFDACQGDSGGPLYYGDVLAGIVSWGRGCGLATHPGVNSRVAYFTNWILANSQ